MTTPPASRRPLPAAWAVLIGMGGTSMTYNIWHATHSGHMPLGLALLYGFSPVFAAACLSHIVSAHKGGWFMKCVTFAVMLGAMGLSIGATASVVRSAAGPLSWLFGLVLDAAALLALQVILSPETRAARKAAKEATNDAADSAANEATAEPSGEPATVPAAGPRIVPSREPRQGAGRLDKSPEADRARQAYRKSLRDGQPLSDRALGEMFSRSRTWGASRIREVERGPKLTARTG